MRWGSALLVLLAFLSLGAGHALGAAIVSPPAGAVVATPPPPVRVVLDAPVERALVRVRVAGPRGASSTQVITGPDAPQSLVVPVREDGTGTYRVAWWGITIDGHPFAGSTSFVVDRPQPAAAALAPDGRDGAGPLSVIARFLVLVGVLGTAGMALTREWVMGGAWRSGGIAPPGDDAPDRVRTAAGRVAAGPVRVWWAVWWGLVSAWALGLAIALPVQAVALGGQWADLLARARWGNTWIVLVVLMALAAVAGVVARRGDGVPGASRPRMYAVALPGVVGAVALAGSGHALSNADRAVSMLTDVVHGWATAAWLGGLVMLLVLALPLVRAMPDPDRVRFGAAVIVRFSSLAVVAVVVLVVTGVYRALAELPSLSALWSTDYGIVLLAKIAIFGVMLVVAAGNRLVLHPRLERAALGIVATGATDGLTALRASVRAEVALGAVVMAAVAVLAGIVPPT